MTTDPRVEELRERVKAHNLCSGTVYNLFNKPFWLQRLLVGLLDHECAVYPHTAHVTVYTTTPQGRRGHTLWSGYFHENVGRLYPTFELDHFIEQVHPKRRDKVLALFQEALDELSGSDPYDFTQYANEELDRHAAKLFDRLNLHYFRELPRWVKVLSLLLAARGCNMKIYQERVELMVSDTGEVHMPYSRFHPLRLHPRFDTVAFLAEFPADQTRAVAAELNTVLSLMPVVDPYQSAG